MESMLGEASATSKGDFVWQAIKLSMAYLRQNKSLDFLSPLLAQTIRGKIENVEKNICGMLFKVAVEQAINSNIVSAENDIDAESLD